MLLHSLEKKCESMAANDVTVNSSMHAEANVEMGFKKY